MQKYILAIDHGTTSTRAVLFDKAANVVEIAQKETTISYPHPGWVEQDANEIWLACLAVMSEVILKSKISPEQVAAIGISNQRETSVLWDASTGLPVSLLLYGSLNKQRVFAMVGRKRGMKIL